MKLKSKLLLKIACKIEIPHRETENWKHEVDFIFFLFFTEKIYPQFQVHHFKLQLNSNLNVRIEIITACKQMTQCLNLLCASKMDNWKLIAYYNKFQILCNQFHYIIKSFNLRKIDKWNNELTIITQTITWLMCTFETHLSKYMYTMISKKVSFCMNSFLHFYHILLSRRKCNLFEIGRNQTQ